jgi:hypothetical protein
MDLELVNFDRPTEVRTFAKGKFELYKVGPTTLGRATYEPGWKWSEHVGIATGATSCQVEHVGLMLSGQDAIARESAPAAGVSELTLRSPCDGFAMLGPFTWLGSRPWRHS